MAKLSEIEGIGATYATKLEAGGIGSIEALLKAGADAKGRKSIAEKCDISDKLILSWLNRADLARVKGISTQYADLLEYAGVDTVPELAQRRADNLHAKMTDVNQQKKLVRQVPALNQVEDWVKQAKNLPRAVHY